MRLYGGRMIKQQVNRHIAESRELRDAIVWDVYPTSHYCRVKIQGSDKYIKAHYNENWESTPQWLKPGNAVRITHPGGNKGRIEVAGHGFLLPSGVGAPSETTPGDTILTGMGLHASGSGMEIIVDTGTYRINGITYTLSTILMDNSAIEMDNAAITMDGIGGVVVLDAAHATLWRYDLIVVGTDGVIDVVKGDTAASFPAVPDTPANHVAIGFVLIPPGITVVLDDLINMDYGDWAVQSRIVVTPAQVRLESSTTSKQDSVAVRVYDQYFRLVKGKLTYNLRVAYELNHYVDIKYGGKWSANHSEIIADSSINFTVRARALVSPVAETAMVFVEETTRGYRYPLIIELYVP